MPHVSRGSILRLILERLNELLTVATGSLRSEYVFTAVFSCIEIDVERQENLLETNFNELETVAPGSVRF